MEYILIENEKCDLILCMNTQAYCGINFFVIWTELPKGLRDSGEVKRGTFLEQERF